MVSSPALSDNGTVVFCGSDDSFVYAIDSASGALKWKLKTGGAVDSSPAVYGSILYVGSNDKKLYAVDVVTGKKRWEFTTGSNIPPHPRQFRQTARWCTLDLRCVPIRKMRTVQSSPQGRIKHGLCVGQKPLCGRRRDRRTEVFLYDWRSSSVFACRFPRRLGCVHRLGRQVDLCSVEPCVQFDDFKLNATSM